MKPKARSGYVNVEPGMEVPKSFTLDAEAAPGAPTLEMTFAAVEGRGVICTRLELRGGPDAPVTAASVRRIRFDELARIATAQNAIVTVGAGDFNFSDGVDGLERQIEAAAASAVRRRGGPYDLVEVGAIYRDTGGGDAAARAIKGAYAVSEGTAWRLIRQAREGGHIPAEPLRRGARTKTAREGNK